ncbi:MAG: anaerobic ribonucleoside-triphosphate reductase activating protein [Rhodoferax sp.]|uniref:anaerobic ribonucleoside-triphosphate reductase activating protein n=1 Tax=Rhodoferax sp. TaxID=50421 RepID=UPI0013FEAD26|nr:anaerobic ribonucleoside-triphosphate reductase activating protein [Rhodoferax sp.]NDP37945.1 anaerobic ribonucleoside-triphosphate reductase activating protein [Rhodoferax sp.]
MSVPTLTSAPVSRLNPAPDGVGGLAPSAPALTLKVGGVTPFSATDYPGQFTAVVFVQGCPWRCGYCHNPHLQPRTARSPVPWSDVLALLQRRVGLIDAVVFSGGEPTMDPALLDAVRAVRALGFGVGLHSAGMYPRRLAEVLPLVDWLGLDVKASWQGYDAITGISDSARQVRAGVERVLASGVAYECRTTVHPALHSEADILALAQGLQAMGVRHYALQVFRATGSRDARLTAASTLGYPGAELLARIAPMFDSFSLRQA